MSNSAWEIFQLQDLLNGVNHGELSIKEFLRTPSLSCSIYHVPVGSNDLSHAHEEDEMYLILEGKGSLRIDGSVQDVSKGSIMYVHAACEHSYFDVQEGITALAFFGTSLRRIKSNT